MTKVGKHPGTPSDIGVREILRRMWDQYETGGSGVPVTQDVDGDESSFLITGVFDHVPVKVTVSTVDLMGDPEPVGPYASTRTSGEVILHSTEWLQERFDVLTNAIDQLREVAQPDESQGGEPLLTKSAANAYGQREYDRGVADGRDQRSDAHKSGFNAGRAIGQSEREAELLDQGWTPPGAIVGVVGDATEWQQKVAQADREGYLRGQKMGMDVARAHGEGGPTDYEVWRDALTLAVTWCPDGATDEATLGQAEIFRDRLKNYPTMSRQEWEDIRVTETEAAADPRDIKPY